MTQTQPYVDDAALEYESLRAYAWANGFFAQIHKNFHPFPGQERNCWYLQKSNKHNPGIHQDSILKFAKSEEVRAWIADYVAAEKAESPNG